MTAAISGLDQVPEIEIALVADLVRNSALAAAARTLEELRDVQDLGVVGIGLGGSEKGFPPEPFADLYARRMSSAHAGEEAGPESIWGAIRFLEVERLGHGTRAEEDESLLDHLAEHRIPLEMCPLSNVRTRVVSSYEAHPVRRYFENGLMVTINTDDPKMFGNSLAEEFQALAGVHGDEIRTLILNGIRASWLPDERKRGLCDAFRNDPDW